MADSAQDVFKNLLGLDKDLLAHEAAAKKAFDGAKKGMRAAIDDESEDEIALAQPSLTAAVEKVDQVLDACTRMHALTAELMKHPEFIASHKAEVSKVVTHFGHKKKEFSDFAKEARNLQDEAKKASALSAKGARETEADLGGLKNRASKIAADILECKKQIPKLDAAARAATDKDNDKDAEKARLQILDLMAQPKRRVDELRPLFLKFKAEHPDLERDQKADLQGVADTLQDATDTLADGQKRFLALIKYKQQAVADNAQRAPAPLEVPKAELIKVAPILGLDPKDAKALTEMAKVFRLPQEKWIAELPKLQARFKVKPLAGKMLVEKIMKQPFFKRQPELVH